MELGLAIGTCPGCNKDLSGHKFVRFASCPIRSDNKPETLDLMKKFKAHDWKAVSEYQQFEGGNDALIAYVISCPSEKGLLVLTNDPVELYSGERMVGYETLSSDETGVVSSLINQDRWEQF
jgi:hypothetical protein